MNQNFATSPVMHSYLPTDDPLSVKRLTERVLEREEEFDIAAK
ncbi:MAG: hypothetical protein WCC17_13250 [Candidatus Nitrosopolaris sp.]